MGRKAKVAPGVGARIASLYEGKDRKRFAAEMGVSDRTLSNYVRGINKPSENFLTLLRDRLGVDINWLLTGKNSDLYFLEYSQRQEEELETRRQEEEKFEKEFSTAIRKIARASGLEEHSPEYRHELPKMAFLPRFDLQASAGAGSLVHSQEAHSLFAVDRDWLSRYVSRSANVGVIEAAGDSMAPTIRNRDLLLVDVREGATVDDLMRGGVYVLTLDGGLVVKRLEIDGNHLVVISDNPAYPPVRIPFAEIDGRVIIHGVVFWSGGALETHR